MKNHHMSRILTLALALIIVLSILTGCGKKDEELIIGKWETNINFSDLMEEALKEDAEAEELLGGADFSGITMLMTMEFKEDGTYSLSMDQASGEEAFKQMAERLIPNLKEVMREEYANATGVGPEAVTDEDLESMLTMMGMSSWDDFGDMILGQMDTEELFSEANASGNYKLKGGKLYTTDSLDTEVSDQSEVDLYEVTETTLKLHAQDTEDTPSFLKELTLTRAN